MVLDLGSGSLLVRHNKCMKSPRMENLQPVQWELNKVLSVPRALLCGGKAVRRPKLTVPQETAFRGSRMATGKQSHLVSTQWSGGSGEEGPSDTPQAPPFPWTQPAACQGQTPAPNLQLKAVQGRKGPPVWAGQAPLCHWVTSESNDLSAVMQKQASGKINPSVSISFQRGPPTPIPAGALESPKVWPQESWDLSFVSPFPAPGKGSPKLSVVGRGYPSPPNFSVEAGAKYRWPLGSGPLPNENRRCGCRGRACRAQGGRLCLPALIGTARQRLLQRT